MKCAAEHPLYDLQRNSQLQKGDNWTYRKVKHEADSRDNKAGLHSGNRSIRAFRDAAGLGGFLPLSGPSETDGQRGQRAGGTEGDQVEAMF